MNLLVIMQNRKNCTIYKDFKNFQKAGNIV